MERLTKLDLYRRKRELSYSLREHKAPKFTVESRERRIQFCQLVCEALNQMGDK